MKMFRARKAWTATVALLLVLRIGAFLTNDRLANRRLRPPSENCALAELADALPAPVWLAFVDVEGTKRLVWIGSIPRFTLRFRVRLVTFLTAIANCSPGNQSQAKGGSWIPWLSPHSVEVRSRSSTPCAAARRYKMQLGANRNRNGNETETGTRLVLRGLSSDE